MKDVYVIGSYTTAVKRYPDKTHRDLVREAVLGVLEDAGFENGQQIESIWSGTATMGNWGQHNICGQVVLTPLISAGILPERVPIFNVENGCATGSTALQGAWRDIQAGMAKCSLAVGFEKLFFPDDPVKTMSQFANGINQIDPEEWITEYENEAKEIGEEVDFRSGGHSLAMDTYGVNAKYHMKKYGTTQRQMAIAAAKNHNNGALNPKAQYHFEMTTEDVLNDREVSYPFTRSMCAPIGDGAAAAIVCDEEIFAMLPDKVQKRAVKIVGVGLSSGKLRRPEEDSLVKVAAARAYAMAGVGPEDMDVAEIHDATSFNEVYVSEMLGFCPKGEGGRLIEAGETAIGGKSPINTSGGLIAKGHPLGATGLSMAYELITQLRGDAGPRQVEGAVYAIEENAGGGVGIEDAACSVIIFKKL